ncbi:hypothetical protein EYF80_014049 [Liparis tanakae]|uniref:Uncharacterized protein n=1 Tax=Liparis tanakae TaxID=230148 RepID=A0A4Z2ICL7_9TELE|nr:hypothetical protein EYF80_014049 [Liparis tanakae]
MTVKNEKCNVPLVNAQVGRRYSKVTCTHKLNCLTSRFLRLLHVLAAGCSLSGVGLRSCQYGVFSAVRLDAAESWDEL